SLNNTSVDAVLNVSNGSTFTFPTSILASADSAISLVIGGTTALTANVQGATFTNARNYSFVISPQSGATGIQNVTFNGNTVTVNVAQRAGAVLIDGQHDTSTSFLVQNNTFTGVGGNGVIGIDANDNAFISGTVSGNRLTNPIGHAIYAAADSNATSRIVFDSNTIQNAGGDGFQLVNFGGTGTSTTDFVVTNNVVDGNSLNPSIAFVGGIGFFSFEDNACVALKNNIISHTPAGYYDIYVEEFGGTNTKVEEVPNTAAVMASPAYVQSINTAPNTSVNGTVMLTNGTLCARP
nr:hypothetical protein [Acidobacteriota bacterium]